MPVISRNYVDKELHELRYILHFSNFAHQFPDFIASTIVAYFQAQIALSDFQY